MFCTVLSTPRKLQAMVYSTFSLADDCVWSLVQVVPITVAKQESAEHTCVCLCVDVECVSCVCECACVCVCVCVCVLCGCCVRGVCVCECVSVCDSMVVCVSCVLCEANFPQYPGAHPRRCLLVLCG
jgi:hypothetical protein